MSRYTKTQITQLSANEQAAIDSINKNFQDIQEAIQDTVSRSGNTPTHMTADLDLNGKRIINTSAPATDNDFVRRVDVVGDIATVQSLVNATTNAAAQTLQAAQEVQEIIQDRNVGLVADDLALGDNSKIKQVAEDKDNIDTVASLEDDVAIVVGLKDDIPVVVQAAEDIDKVEDIADDITAVASNATNITAVAENEENINAVNANKTNIDAVNANKTNIDAVAGNETNINAVNSNKTNIDSVAGNSSNINSVATSITNVNAVAADLSNINACAAELPNILSKANVSLNNLDTSGENKFAAKVNLNLENMNPSSTSKEAIIAWGMPNYSAGVALTVSTTEKSYTCTKKGRIDYFLGYDTGTDGTYVKVNNVTMMSTTVSSGYPKLLCGTLDLNTGDVVKYKINSTTTTSKMVFYPYKGV